MNLAINHKFLLHCDNEQCTNQGLMVKMDNKYPWQNHLLDLPFQDIHHIISKMFSGKNSALGTGYGALAQRAIGSNSNQLSTDN